MSDRTYRCGDTEDGGNAEFARHCGGVMISLHAHDMAAPMGYRCYDCKAVFCRACAPLHFGEEYQKARSALAASQADVTRLTAKLAVSVRALVVSQGEVERIKRELYLESGRLAAARGQLERFPVHVTRLRGNLERARGLLARVVSGGRFATGEFGVVLDDIRAFLATPTPTASPEPEATTERVATCAKHGANRWTDAGGIWRCAECERPAPYRASPEVTAKEPRP